MSWTRLRWGTLPQRGTGWEEATQLSGADSARDTTGAARGAGRETSADQHAPGLQASNSVPSSPGSFCYSVDLAIHPSACLYSLGLETRRQKYSRQIFGVRPT